MAVDDGFRGLKIPTASDFKELTKLEPELAKQVLAEKLGIPPYIDEKDPQKSPFINYIHENIVFAVEKGIPWKHISLVVKFAHVYLKGILVEGHSLSDAVKDFKKKFEILNVLNDRHKKQYTDFIYDTVLTHYNLYKFVFSQLRDDIKPQVKKYIEVPPDTVRLRSGVTQEVYDYHQKVAQVETKEAETMSRLKEQERALEQIEAIKAAEYTSNALNAEPTPYTKEGLQGMIKDVLKCYLDLKEKELKNKAEEVIEDLTYKLEKTAIPRPLALGSPPRYKAKDHRTSLKADTSKNKFGSGRSRSKSGNLKSK